MDLSWFSQIHASSYSILLSASPNFSNPAVNQSGLTDTVYSLSGLENSTTYYWQVTPSNVAGAGDPSSIRAFTTIVALPVAPIQAEPAHEAMNIPVEVTLRWHAIADAEQYHLQLSNDIDFSGVVSDIENLTDTFHIVSELENSTDYFWKVRASNVAGSGPFSEISKFTTMAALGFGNMAQFNLLDLSLHAYPNPFDKEIYLMVWIPEATTTIVSVYNSIGQLVNILHSGPMEQGIHRLTWKGLNANGGTLSSGIYYCRVTTDHEIKVCKVVFNQ